MTMNHKLTVEETKTFILMLLHAYAEIEALEYEKTTLVNKINNIDDVKRKIPEPEYLQEPKLELERTDYKYHYERTYNEFLDALEGIVLGCLAASPLLSICLFFGGIFASVYFLGFIPLLVVIGIIIVGTIIGELFRSKKTSKYQKAAKSSNARSKRNHPKEVEVIKHENDMLKSGHYYAVKREEERVNRAKAEKSILQTHQNSIDKRLTSAYELRNKLKNMNVIHSKYTTPTNLAIIWDLLDTGRTKSLTIDGADPGAYNLLETHEFREKLLKTINYGFFSIATELRELKYKLNVISDQNNRMLSLAEKSSQELYELKLASTENSKIIMRDNKKILENAKLTAYTTKKIEENTAAQLALDLYSKRMKGEIAPNTLLSQFKSNKNLNMYL